MACDPAQLADQAKCIQQCLMPGAQLPALISLFCQIVDAGGTGGVPALPDGQIFVGNALNKATAVSMSKDATIDDTGAVTLANTATARTDIGLGTTNDVQFKSDTSNFHRGTEVAVAALNIDWSAGEIFTKTLGGAGNIFTFSNVTSGRVITVILTAGATGTVTWPAVVWPGGVAPVQTFSRVDIYTFVAIGAGTIYGSAVQNMS